jgi:hypothetical protein
LAGRLKLPSKIVGVTTRKNEIDHLATELR